NAEDTAPDGQAPGALQGRSGDAAEGNDGALPAAPGEPALRLPSDAAPAADLRRAVQRTLARDRAAPRTVRSLDQRPLSAGSPDDSGCPGDFAVDRGRSTRSDA